MFNLLSVCFLVYGVLMLLGGIFGFIKAGSKVSLIMGIISGILIFLGVVFLERGQYSAGRAVLAFTSFILSGIFALRLLKTRKFMPSGMLLALSLIASALAIQLFILGG